MAPFCSTGNETPPFVFLEDGRKWSTLWLSREKKCRVIGGTKERKHKLLDHRLWYLSPRISGPGNQMGGGCCSSTWMPNREENAAGWKGNNHKYVDHTGMTNESWVFAHADLSFLSLSGWTGVMKAGVMFAGVAIKRSDEKHRIELIKSSYPTKKHFYLLPRCFWMLCIWAVSHTSSHAQPGKERCVRVCLTSKWPKKETVITPKAVSSRSNVGLQAGNATHCDKLTQTGFFVHRKEKLIELHLPNSQEGTQRGHIL